MRTFEIDDVQAREHDGIEGFVQPGTLAQGYLWLSLTRSELREALPQVQEALQALTGTHLLELHVADLLNDHLPSHYDYTSQYDLLVVRRLTTRPAPQAAAADAAQAAATPKPRRVPPALRNIDTCPVGFAVFDQLLLSVHPDDAAVRDQVAARLLLTGDASQLPETRTNHARQPDNPAELMLRVIDRIVDDYLELRRDLTRQLEHWQRVLIDRRTHFSDWGALLQTRQALHHLEEVCEDQRGAMRDWLDALETLPPSTPGDSRERELLLVRSRDLLEHIERMLHHVHRLEQNAESAVQLHFSVQSHRTNSIMRILTVLTAVFLPLNLIAGIFGMNFENLPLIHKSDGFWFAIGFMVLTTLVLMLVFWRKRYLGRTGQ